MDKLTLYKILGKNGAEKSASGNPVVLTDMREEQPLDITASWEPAQEGEGDPYPPGGGVNLLDISGMKARTRDGISIELKNGGIWVHGTAEKSVDSPTFDMSFLTAGTYSGISVDGIVQQLITEEDGKMVWSKFDKTPVKVAEGTIIKYYYFVVIKGTTIDTVIYPMVCKSDVWQTDYSPYSNIRPITGRDSITVERCGENIVNIPIATVVNGISVIQESDGRYHLKGTLAGDGFALPLKNISLPPGTYCVKTANLDNIVITLRKVVNGSTSAWIETTDNTGGRAGKLTERTVISFAIYGSSKLLKVGMELDGYLELMLVADDTQPDNYIPYQGDAMELSLPSTMYGGKLNMNGDGMQEWALLTFDGTEEWMLGVGATKNYKLYINNKANPLSACICNTFPWKQYAYASEGNEGFFAFESNGLCIHYNVTNTWSTLDDWKAFLADQYAAGTPVQIAYRLTEPIPFKATGASAIKALPGTNTIMTDADSATVKSGTETMRAKKIAMLLGE